MLQQIQTLLHPVIVQIAERTHIGYGLEQTADMPPAQTELLLELFYTTEEQYDKILADYPSLASEIIEKTVTEGAHRVICYTQILTEIPDFHRNLEKFEIYNGNLDRDARLACPLQTLYKIIDLFQNDRSFP